MDWSFAVKTHTLHIAAHRTHTHAGRFQLNADNSLTCVQCLTKKCSKCSNAIDPEAHHILIEGQSFHSACFTCGECHTPIPDGEPFAGDAGQPRCVVCARLDFILALPRVCWACQMPIEDAEYLCTSPAGEAVASSSIFHVNCMRCAICFVDVSQRFMMRNEMIFCVPHYLEVEQELGASSSAVVAAVRGQGGAVEEAEILFADADGRRGSDSGGGSGSDSGASGGGGGAAGGSDPRARRLDGAVRYSVSNVDALVGAEFLDSMRRSSSGTTPAGAAMAERQSTALRRASRGDVTESPLVRDALVDVSYYHATAAGAGSGSSAKAQKGTAKDAGAAATAAVAAGATKAGPASAGRVGSGAGPVGAASLAASIDDPSFEERHGFARLGAASVSTLTLPADVAAPRDLPDLLFVDCALAPGQIRPVRAGSVARLVERLTYEFYPDSEFMQCFFLTYRSFATPLELLSLLIRRFHAEGVASSLGGSSSSKSMLVPIRLRVFNALKYWVSVHFYDFVDSDQLVARTKAFCRHTLSAVMPLAGRQLLRNIEFMQITRGKRERTLVARKPPKPSIPKHLGTPGEENVLLINEVELARQLTLIEYAIFAAIRPEECVKKRWGASEHESQAPNILSMARRFNVVSRWVSSSIVRVVDAKKRRGLMRYFLRVAQRLVKLNNFNGVMEILAGLHSSSVFRLKKTWNSLPRKARKQYDALERLTNSAKNYAVLREALRASNPPCVPYLGMFLTDLTFIEDGLADHVTTPGPPPLSLVNFAKLRMISVVIRGIQLFQQEPYFLQRVPIIQDYLLRLRPMSEEEMFAQSLLREPREPRPSDAAAPPPAGPVAALRASPASRASSPAPDSPPSRPSTPRAVTG